jgi:5-methylcytosine-specific restriction endonuclease McrA
MIMNKARQKIWNKSGGLCWYCGCQLPEKGWHADHFHPIRRNWWAGAEEKCVNPQHDTEENKVPACPSCNILKGSDTLEGFRRTIKHFVHTLNNYHNQYKFAKKYGLVKETDLPVVFWFEKNGR